MNLKADAPFFEAAFDRNDYEVSPKSRGSALKTPWDGSSASPHRSQYQVSSIIAPQDMAETPLWPARPFGPGNDLLSNRAGATALLPVTNAARRRYHIHFVRALPRIKFYLGWNYEVTWQKVVSPRRDSKQSLLPLAEKRALCNHDSLPA